MMITSQVISDNAIDNSEPTAQFTIIFIMTSQESELTIYTTKHVHLVDELEICVRTKHMDQIYAREYIQFYM